MDAEEQQPPLETQESQEEPKPKRTAKKRRRPKQALRITKKAMAKFDKTVLKEYKKYVNAIRRRKSCRIMSFEAFGKKHMSKSKKSKRKGKGKGKAAVEAEAAPLDETEVAESAEETQVAEGPLGPAEETQVAEGPLGPAEEPPADESLEASASAAPEETEPMPPPKEIEPPSAATGIAQSVSDAAKSVTDSLGLSSTAEKKGGKKKRGSKRRGSKRL